MFFAGRKRNQRLNFFRPRLEALEQRDLLAPLFVINTNDSGTGSLRPVSSTTHIRAISNARLRVGDQGIRTGSDALTTVPLPGVDVSLNWPPSAVARSRSPMSP